MTAGSDCGLSAAGTLEIKVEGRVSTVLTGTLYSVQ